LLLNDGKVSVKICLPFAVFELKKGVHRWGKAWKTNIFLEWTRFEKFSIEKIGVSAAAKQGTRKRPHTARFPSISRV
jgi:hypothetical protein